MLLTHCPLQNHHCTQSQNRQAILISSGTTGPRSLIALDSCNSSLPVLKIDGDYTGLWDHREAHNSPSDIIVFLQTWTNQAKDLPDRLFTKPFVLCWSNYKYHPVPFTVSHKILNSTDLLWKLAQKKAGTDKYRWNRNINLYSPI